ncbi:MAG: tetratricopeptide repeat protein [Phycisphaerales bacterium]
MSGATDLFAAAQTYLRAGRLDEARAACVKAVDAAPEDARPHHLLGVILTQSGDPQGAIPMLERAEALAPRQPGILHGLGVALRDAGRTRDAADVLRRAIELAPRQSALHVDLGIAHLNAGNGEAARDSFEEAARINPGDARAHFRIGRFHLDEGRPTLALESLQRSVAAAPRFVPARAALAAAERQLGRPEEAERSLRTACDLAPRSPRIQRDLGDVLLHNGKTSEAAARLEKAVSLDPTDADALAALGDAYRSQQALDKALAAYDKAISKDGGHVRARYGAAATYERTSRLEDADAHVDRVLKHVPGHAPARILKGRIDRRRNRHVDALRALAPVARDAMIPDVMRGTAEVEIGRVLHDQGRHADAFESLLSGKARLAGVPHEAASIRRGVLETLERARGWAASAEFSPTTPDDDAPAPIFLIGFPRSGTTLTEQILHAHSAIAATDEAPLIDQTLRDQGLADPARLPDALSDVDGATLTLMRRVYWRHACDLMGWTTPPDGVRLIDKMPLNIANIAVIARLFPEAPIIHVRRDPRDVCMSCMMQPFRPEILVSRFDTPERLAAFQVAAERFVDCCRDRLGRTWIDVRYEDIVHDFEGEARRLVAALDLPWEDSVLRFNEAVASRMISTPSYDSVNKPVFAGSQGRWRTYEGPLQGAAEILRPLCGGA